MKVNDFLSEYKITFDGGVYNLKRKRYLKWDISTGYASVVLSKKGKKQKFLVHRLVALVHIPNPLNKPCVNHNDGNKLNNHGSNLMWVTYSENELHSRRILGKKIIYSKESRMKISLKAKGRDMSQLIQKSIEVRRGKPAPNRIKVTLNNQTTFDSLTHAAKATGVLVTSISNNLCGISKSTRVGVWSICK